MMKKSLVLGSLLSTVCLASADAHTGYFKSGFLAGGHVGVGFGNGKFTGTFNSPGVAPVVGTASGSKTSSVIGVRAAYRHILNGGYTFGLGAELNFFPSSQISKQVPLNLPPVFNFNNELKRDYSFVPSIMLGKVLCGRYHVELGLGLAITRFKQKYNGGLVPISGQATQTKLGFVPSLGVEYALTNNVSLTGNVSYEIYKKISKTFATTVAAGSSYTTSIKPNYVNLKVGLVYRF